MKLAAVALVACSSTAAVPSPSRDEIDKDIEDACPKVTAPYVYRVDKDGKTSWLLGTRHTSVTIGKFPVRVLAHLRSAKTAVFEIAPDAIVAPRPPYTGRPVRELLGERRWAKYEELVGTRRARAVETASPMVAHATLTMMYENTAVKLEADLAHAAAEAHVPTQGLETVAFQDKAIGDAIASVDQLGALIDGTSRDKMRTASLAILRAYCTGTDIHTAGADDEKVLFERNRTWIPKLEALHAAGGAFIAVGFLHLGGEHGLVKLLEGDGFTVTRTLDY